MLGNPLPDIAAGGASYESMATGGRPLTDGGMVYARLWNPTVARFEDALAALEHAETSVAFASGLPLEPQHRELLIVPASFSTVLTGFLLLTTRIKAITQAIGYLVLENGIFIFGMLLVDAMPFLVEIGVLLDLHGLVSNAMTESADVMLACKEYPHTDFDERARLTYQLTAKAARGEIKPVMAYRWVPMLAMHHPTREPMRGLVDRTTALEVTGRALAISLLHGFPWSDCADGGASVLVTSGTPC